MPEREYQDVPADEMDDHFRAIVREEIASLAGLALRRLQDENFTRSIEGNIAAMKAKEVVGHFWGEVLAEYGGGKEIEQDGGAVDYHFPDESSDK